MKKERKTRETDKRPDPKPKKRAALWQLYLLHDELERQRIRHTNRISSVENGKSNFSDTVEKTFLEDISLDQVEKAYKKAMIDMGKALCPGIWEWVTSIKGLGSGKMAAQLLAMIDDIERFDNISKLWRFAGEAVFDGKAERGMKGDKMHYNKRLKSLCYLIGDSFIKQQTPVYVDVYYEAKRKLREQHPEAIKAPEDSPWKKIYTDSHIDRMARRKMIKVFLSHLWVQWRTIEGLPVTEPYAQAILRHDGIIEPPEL